MGACSVQAWVLGFRAQWTPGIYRRHKGMGGVLTGAVRKNFEKRPDVHRRPSRWPE